ncbi:MAG: histidinol-phosphatase HisJ [archaeon]|nr:histidinol-phosphatase HisJ [archaeon]
MGLIDYHTHNKLCNHATGSLEDYVKDALVKNMAEIGFSDHFPYDILPKDPLFPFQKLIEKYAMSYKKFPKYIRNAKILQKKYEDSIKIKISTEIDYMDGKLKYYKKYLEPFMDDFDYLLGSVHFLQWDELKRWVVTMKGARKKIELYGEEKICLEYYDIIQKMVNTGFFDVVGHLDTIKVPKKVNYNKKSWQKLLDLLDSIKNHGMAVEINTSGFWKGAGEQFPSDNIIKELIQRDISIVLGSDAHKPKYVGNKFEEMIVKIKKMGLTHFCSYTKRTKSLIEIS